MTNTLPEQSPSQSSHGSNRLSAEAALRAYARMMNTLDPSHLESFLAEDFHYASQWVFS